MEEVSLLKLSIVIVNYSTPVFVFECLETLFPEILDLGAKIILVDNHSPDDSVKKINTWLDQHDTQNQVIFVQSITNGGFASGNNIGIKALKAKYYLLLNSDTLVRPGAIRLLLETVKQYPNAGLYSPGLEWSDGQGQESCFRFHSPVSEFLSGAQTGFIDRFFKGKVVPLSVENTITYPQWTSFACVLIKDKVFQDIGQLDDGYFMYFEDVEFCYRARHAGYSIVHNPKPRIVHFHGGSSKINEMTLNKKKLPRYYYESRARYFHHTCGWWGLTVANLLWSIGRVISKSRQILGRKDKATVKNQWLDIWINWLNPKAKYTHPD